MITLVFTGCDNKKVNKEKEYETIEIKDEKTGYTTTFKYEKGKDYKITDTETDGKYVKVEMEAKSLNLEVEMYYFDITNIGWNNNIESRKNKKVFYKNASKQDINDKMLLRFETIGIVSNIVRESSPISSFGFSQ
jgi:hypothetical protein